VYLARIIGRVVATTRYQPGLEGVKLHWIQPLDEGGAASGEPLVACSALDVGPGDFVHFIDGREAALALPDETFVPVDVTVTGYVEQAVIGARDLARLED